MSIVFGKILNPKNTSQIRVEETHVLSYAWKKPVIIFYKERSKDPEVKPLAVIKARKLTITRTEDKLSGNIKDFFPIMGDIDYIASDEGKNDRYVLCWFDDKEEDFSKFWRQLTGATFPDGISFTTDEGGKRTYNADCKAKHAKLV